MRCSRLVVLLAASIALVACYDFDSAYDDYCDAGHCDGGASGGGTGGGAADDAGTGGGMPDDAGTGGGGAVDDGGTDDAGVEDAGTEDAGTGDAGTIDAGCGTPSRLVITSAPQTMMAGDCSMAVTVQLRDACGMSVIPPVAVPLSFTTPASLTVFSDAACISMSPQWQIPGGSSDFTFFVKASTAGTPTLQVNASGLTSASQRFTVTCPTGQRACNGACISNGACCSDTECNDGGVAWVCNTSNTCAPPPCGSFPSGCTTLDYVDRTAASANRTVTFDSSGYSPKCMRVLTYQTVTFSGTFGIHPLVQDCGPSDRQLTTTFGTTKTATFPSLGEYGYHCAFHPTFERGAIKVP